MTAHDPHRRKRLLAFIRRYTNLNGYPPTIREMMPAVGLSSTAAVHHHLTQLQKSGELERDPHRSRSIRTPRYFRKVGHPSRGRVHATILPPYKGFSWRCGCGVSSDPSNAGQSTEWLDDIEGFTPCAFIQNALDKGWWNA